MARPPSGPIGNSPRDVRDDAVGVPADNVKAPEPPRWPPKRKKITSNTFHAKVSGGTAPKRADRSPHFRRGGMVKAYAGGGSVEKPPAKPEVEPLKVDPRGALGSALIRQRPAGTYKGIDWEPPAGRAAGGSVETKMEKRDELPGEQKNDPFAKQNLKRGGGVLSAKQRQSLPKSSFALPGKGEGPKGAGAGSYPIPDPSHARNALARVSQHGSSAEKAKVRAKVKAKFPGIGQK